MKNPLATYYLNNIERNFKRSYEPSDNYTWDDYIKDFEKYTGHTFEELKHGSVVKAKYMYELSLKKRDEKIDRNFKSFDKQRSQFYDNEGNLCDDKWNELVIARENYTKKELGVELLESLKDDYIGSEYEITGELNEELTELFSELVTYQSQIHVYEDVSKERINIFILDYNLDCYNHYDAIHRFWGKVYFLRKEYWPKDKYTEMEAGAEKLRTYGIENCKNFKQVIDMFPYAVGTENWVKHYFNRLDKEELEKYKHYDFYINFMIYSPITGFGGDNLPAHFVKGKINWN